MSKKTLEIIFAKLSRLDEYLKFLTDISKARKESFISDYRIYGVAERFLHLSIEILIDVGKLTVIELKFERPENSHEIFEILAKNKIISKPLYKRLSGIAGFRNILVHEYMKIDRAIVYKNLKSGLKDIRDFKKAIVKKFK